MWVDSLPEFVVILPPLLAVAVALVAKNALMALLCGVVSGAWLVHGPNPLVALARTVDTHLPATIASMDRARMIIFTLALGGMVGILNKGGGARALVDRVSSRARGRRGGMLTACAAGLVVFFDDYANCLLVGSTMRPLTDRLRISREKLAYLLDSTAAPIATVAPISTWIGFQLGLLEPYAADPRWGTYRSVYELFLVTIPYAFYSLFTLAFVLLVASTGRDFGPMRRAEQRAWETGQLHRVGATPLVDNPTDQNENSPEAARPWIAVVPLLALLFLVVFGLYASGREHSADGAPLREVISRAETTRVLLWTAFGGGLCALVCSVVSRSLGFRAAVEAWLAGAKSMVGAAFILGLAWALGSLCSDYLGTGQWVVAHLRPSVRWLPLLTFLLAGGTAFSTGSSFSTMAIIFPMAGPLAFSLTEVGVSSGDAETVRAATLGAVLSGSVFGDHCSPLSDTTLLSSLGAGADHVDHVRTQLPYALVCGTTAAALGYLPSGFGVPPWVLLPAGVLVLAFIVLRVGRRTDSVASRDEQNR